MDGFGKGLGTGVLSGLQGSGIRRPSDTTKEAVGDVGVGGEGRHPSPADEFREILRAEIAQTLPEGGDPDAELGYLAELEMLRAKIRQLTAALEGGEALKAENARLEAAIAAQKAPQPPELQEMAELRDRQWRNQCVNNLKLLGLAVRLYASDNQDNFPSELTQLHRYFGDDFKVLVCPADESRPVAKDAVSLTAANCSYEFLAPGPGKFETDPRRVRPECPAAGATGRRKGDT